MRRRAESVLARVATPTVATIIGLISLLSVPATLALSALTNQLPNSSGGVVSGAAGIVFVVVFTTVGVVVAWRQPRNPMGWLLIGVALAVQISGCASTYAYLDYTVHRGALVLGPVAVLLSPSWEYAFVLLPLVIMLFPDGHVPRGWRWPTRAYLTVSCVVFVATIEIAISDLSLARPVDASGNLVGMNHPVGAHAWFAVVQPIAFVACVLLVLSAATYQAWSFHRAGGERRQQLKWLGFGVVVALVCLATNVATGGGSGVVGNLTFSLGLAAVPVGMGIAILKYRLYEIDRLISRTLAYAIVTASSAERSWGWWSC